MLFLFYVSIDVKHSLCVAKAEKLVLTLYMVILPSSPTRPLPHLQMTGLPGQQDLARPLRWSHLVHPLLSRAVSN